MVPVAGLHGSRGSDHRRISFCMCAGCNCGAAGGVLYLWCLFGRKVQTRFILPERSEQESVFQVKMGLENQSFYPVFRGNGSIHWENLLTGENGDKELELSLRGKKKNWSLFRAEAIAVAVSGFSLRTGKYGIFSGSLPLNGGQVSAGIWS